MHERLWAWFVDHAHRPHALRWLALISFTDAIFFPVAPEIYIAALSLAHPNRWKIYFLVGTTFSILGSVAGYGIAAFLFSQFGEPILSFYGLQQAFAYAKIHIMGHVFVAMALASFTPIPDKVFIYAAGFLSVPFVPFLLGYALGRGARMALVAYFVARYGKEALTLINKYLLWFTLLLLTLATIYTMVHWHLLPWF